MTRAPLTDRATEGQNQGSASQYPLGLTLVYCDGLTRAGEQLSLVPERSPVAIGYDERLFPGGPLEDPRMGKRHATLKFDRGHWMVLDRGHKSGTSVDERRIREHVLTPGESIRIGSTFMVFGHIAPRNRALMLNSVGAAMADVEERLTRIARTVHPLLLLGENGTGKELVAHEVHRLSGRTGPFLSLNCSKFSGDALQLALFGQGQTPPARLAPELGAGAGQSDPMSSSAGLWPDGSPAVANTPDGLFLRGHNGTVFLDEVGEMPVDAQRRLLRLLEQGRFVPIDAHDEVEVTARLVAATDREVDASGGEHMLPELYERLARWSVKLPALRERKEDLGVLLRVLLGRGGARLDVTPELMAALLAADWRLNIRGLIQTLQIARHALPGASRLDLDPAVKAALAAR